jgi:hypothetical protein
VTRQIWKYDLEITDEQSFKMPKDAELLTVQLQYGVPMLWAVVNPFAPGRPYRTIFIHGTGHPVDPPRPEICRHVSSERRRSGVSRI